MKSKKTMSQESRQRKEADLMERQQNYEKKAYEAETEIATKRTGTLTSNYDKSK